jgi:hypothetical protein
LLAQVKVAQDKLPLVLPPRDGTHLKNRFREALLGRKRIFRNEGRFVVSVRIEAAAARLIRGDDIAQRALLLLGERELADWCACP